MKKNGTNDLTVSSKRTVFTGNRDERTKLCSKRTDYVKEKGTKELTIRFKRTKYLEDPGAKVIAINYKRTKYT